MRKIMILVFLLSFAAIAYGAECDFSINTDVNVQKCFGGSGNQCEGGDPKHAITKNLKDCTAEGYATIGSIMHDNCCLNNPDGYMCKGSRQTSDLVWGLGGDADRHICGQEWNKAWYDSDNNRGWTVTFGPYVKGGKTDDLTRANARDGQVYDSHGLFKRMWVRDQKTGGDKNKWSNVKETKATLKLKAPAGTKFEFAEDKQFCASGKWANGACK